MTKETFTQTQLEERLTHLLGCSIQKASDRQVYDALLKLSQSMAEQRQSQAGGKKLYYISAEFLIGKLLSNNLINLGIYDQTAKLLEQNGKHMGDIEEIENEPSLGNGGLGRLAACFLDSIATLNLNGDGVGLNYHFGLFRQYFEKNAQQVRPDVWLTDDSWLIRSDRHYDVTMGGRTYTSTLYDILVTGYEGRTNRLHLFDLDTVDESLVKDGIDFDKTAIDKNLTLFLYPDDSDNDGRKLRIYQQYFMVSNAAHLILDEAVEQGCKLTDLDEYAVIQINDTHPSMVIPELIRQLMERGLSMNDAIAVTSKCCAYTNHTILAEALEKWPLSYLEEIVPQLCPIIEILDDRIRRKVDDVSTAIIDSNDLVHMAHMDIHYGISVNGVAALHTEILKNTELNAFYKLYPEKFNNKTNGITFRRWLMSCNPELTGYLRSKIGDGFLKDASLLEHFKPLLEDQQVLKDLIQIKQTKKHQFAAWLKQKQGIEVDPESIFDVQSKRLHEYKRQQLNLLWAIHTYLRIKEGYRPERKITLLFGAKAAPAYIIAQDIIHGILCLQEIIDHDPEVKPYLQVVMIENYNVTAAEKLIPACDLSEQISLASKEASGTGNMKFMLNGAVTLGTEDGANVEIHELVGDENIYVFGQQADEVIRAYEQHSYVSKDWYDKNETLKEAVDFLVGEQMLAVGDEHRLNRLYKELLNKDWFMTFPDFDSYLEARAQAYADYEDRLAWSKKCGVNIAMAGFFSSDRTIAQYNQDIWHLN